LTFATASSPSADIENSTAVSAVATSSMFWRNSLVLKRTRVEFQSNLLDFRRSWAMAR